MEGKKECFKRISIKRIKEFNKQNANNLNVLRYRKHETISQQQNKYVETDTQFIEDIKRISSIKQDLISNILHYGQAKKEITDEICDEIDYKARIHWDANILNSNTIKVFEDVESQLRCECGCRRAKGQNIDMFADQQKLNVLGPGVILHFIYLKSIIINICFIIAIYGIYAMTTNLSGNSANLDQCSGSLYCIFQRVSSSQNKQIGKSQSIQRWLGVIFCMLWIFSIRFIKHYGKQKAKSVDDRLNSASDFAIKIDDLPNSQYIEQQLLQYLDQLWQKIPDSEDKEELENQESQGSSQNQNIQQDLTNRFGVKSIQVVYNLQWSRKMVDEIFESSRIVYQLLQKNQVTDIKNIVSNFKLYKFNKSRLISTYQLLRDLRKKFFNDTDFRKNITTSCCIIEFHKQEQKDYILKYFGAQKTSYLKTLQQRLKKWIFPSSKVTLFKGWTLKITRAPQPSDILWHNCEKAYSLVRITCIHSITALIIIISFGMISGLNIVKQIVTKNSQNSNNYDLVIASLAIVITLQLVNKLIWFTLFYLLEYEYNHCLTDKIISQMNKSIFAMSVNVIVVPIMSTYILQGKLYGSNGLVGMSFDYQISFLVVAFVNSFDPLDFIKRIALWIRIIRNTIIRFACAKIHQINPQKGIPEVNQIYQGPDFDIAQNYVRVTGAVFHAVFFCCLQPSVLFLAVVMIFVFYILSKYKLYRICKIPQVTDYMVFDAAVYQANAVPVIYAIGAIVISYFQKTENLQKQMNYLPNFICFGLGILNFANPGDFVNKIMNFFINKFNTKTKKKPQQNQRQNKQSLRSSISNTIIVNRNQTYFQGSNALTLLGFQSMLKGQSVKNLTKQLVNFCQGFLKGEFVEQKPQIGTIKDMFPPNNVEDKIKYGNFLLPPIPNPKKFRNSASIPQTHSISINNQ